MNDIQSKLLYLFKHFIALCNDFNLNWFADGGTLLGVIRNNGFIPWDDDIDVCMPRKDFDELSKIMHKNPHNGDVFWQDTVTDSEYFNIHARLRLDGTTAISERELGLKSHKGMFIDIYPIDEVPNDTDKICNLLYAIRNAAEDMKDNDINKSSYEFMQHLLAKQHGDKVGALCFSAYKKYKNVAVSKDAYDFFYTYEFEDIVVRVPHKFEEILTLWYGDDWRTPREEQSFHSTFIDSEHDYNEYNSAKSMSDLYDILERLR